MTAIVSEFAKRPETAALVSPDKFPNNIGEVFFDVNKKGRADVMIIQEDSQEDIPFDSSDTRSKTNPRYNAFSD